MLLIISNVWEVIDLPHPYEGQNQGHLILTTEHTEPWRSEGFGVLLKGNNSDHMSASIKGLGALTLTQKSRWCLMETHNLSQFWYRCHGYDLVMIPSRVRVRNIS